MFNLISSYCKSSYVCKKKTDSVFYFLSISDKCGSNPIFTNNSNLTSTLAISFWSLVAVSKDLIYKQLIL